MKALTLWQPWASLVAIGAKEYETRSWPTRYRGSLVIHASKHFTADERRYASALHFRQKLDPVGILTPDDLPLGVALCVVDLVDVIPTQYLVGEIGNYERAFGNWSQGRFAWKLENVRVFDVPIPASGSQGLWDWKLPLPFAV